MKSFIYQSLIIASFFLFLSSCATPRSIAYKDFYSHLKVPVQNSLQDRQSPYFLIIYVDARHLDYTNNASFFRTVAKHPSDFSKTGDVGHAWIYLQGMIDDEMVYLEGGHSGETGTFQAKYFDGIMNYIDFGYANPTRKQKQNPCFEPNPVKYLQAIQHDGYFEWGPGFHKPTFAAKIDLSQEQFDVILNYIYSYNFRHYSLTGNQCSSFVSDITSLAGVDLDCKVSIKIDPVMMFKHEKIRFWEDPCYSVLTISTPDVLEKSLMQAVREGKMQKIFP